MRVEDTATTYLLPAVAGQAMLAMRDGACYVDEIARRVFAHRRRLGPASAALAAITSIGTITPALLLWFTFLIGCGLDLRGFQWATIAGMFHDTADDV